MLKKSKHSRVFVILLILSIIFLLPIVKAACSLGANPLSMDARAIPGQTVIATWNFYNLYGDRTTHIKVSLAEGPDWQVSYEPALHEANYEVMGVEQTIEENVAVEVIPVVDSIPEIIPEGIDYVKHPKEAGYIPVKPVRIYIKIPEDAELWKNYDLVFEAVGNCFMEPGAVMPAVATQLKLSIKTISGGYYEKEIPEEKEGPARIAGEAGITGAVIGPLKENKLVAFLFLIIILLVVMIIVNTKKLKESKKKR